MAITVPSAPPNMWHANRYNAKLQALLDDLFKGISSNLKNATSLHEAYRGELFKAEAVKEFEERARPIIAAELAGMVAYNKAKMIKEFRAALGVDITHVLNEIPMQGFLHDKINENVDLIRTIHPRAKATFADESIKLFFTDKKALDRLELKKFVTKHVKKSPFADVVGGITTKGNEITTGLGKDLGRLVGKDFTDIPTFKENLRVLLESKKYKNKIQKGWEKELRRFTNNLDKPLTKRQIRAGINKITKKVNERAKYQIYRIAQDQTSKTAGQFAKKTQTEMDIKEYIWDTAGDERVRLTHAVLDGRVRKWSDYPIPGSEILCRCTDRAVIDPKKIEEWRREAPPELESAYVDPPAKVPFDPNRPFVTTDVKHLKLKKGISKKDLRKKIKGK